MKNIIIPEITIPIIYGINNVPKIQINNKMSNKNIFPILRINNTLIIIIPIINHFLSSINKAPTNYSYNEHVVHYTFFNS